MRVPYTVICEIAAKIGRHPQTVARRVAGHPTTENTAVMVDRELVSRGYAPPSAQDAAARPSSPPEGP